MDKNLICISWLNGRVKAAAVDRSGAATSWEHSAMVPDFSNFGKIVAEAIQQTRSSAKHVSMVLAHPRHIHQVLEVPPAKRGTLVKLLQRRVQSLKTFEGEAAWAWQPAMPTKNSNAVLLHVFPKTLVDQLTAACEGTDRQLIRLVPTTAVLASQLKKLSVPKGELALLAAETGSTTTVVIGASDGRVCLARVLRGRWDQPLDTLTVDLTRTIGFAEQQSGLVVGTVWLFGAGAQAQVPTLEAALRLPVKLSPVESTPFYWAEESANLLENDDGNLISRQLREAPKRRRLITAVGVMLFFLLVLAVGGASVVEVLRRDWLQTIKEQKMESAQLLDQRNKWQQRYRDLAAKREFVHVVMEGKLPPVPGWFLGYLGETVPEELFLTEVQIARTNDAWWVKLAGAAQPTTNAAPAAVFRQATSDMTNHLTTGPFQLKISRCVIGEGLRKTPFPADPGKTNTTFLIEGVIR